MRTLIYLLALAAAPALAQTVKVTPLGSHDGELCAFDRAIIFEDPDGTRVLYDAGRTVRGPGDPRLGKIDAVLLTHVHGDHIGDSHSPAANAGTCAAPDVSVGDTPNSNTVNVTTLPGSGGGACLATVTVQNQRIAGFCNAAVSIGGQTLKAR